MIIDFHTHKSETAEDILSIRSFCITEVDSRQIITQPHSIGLHPWNIPHDNWFEQLKQYSINPQCLLIGECGIDKLRGDTLKNQITHFKQHIQLSETLHKPLCIHCVKAFNEIIELRKESNSNQPWIIHGFHGNEQLATQLLTHNIYVSFGTYITNPIHQKTQIAMKKLGIGNFMLETDTSPLPIQNIYQSVSEIFDTTITKLTSQINNLFVSLQKI